MLFIAGLQGCVEAFDHLARKFFEAENSRQSSIVEEAESKLRSITDKKEKTAGELYVNIMKKIKELGLDFIETEKQRVNKLLKDKITDKKREVFRTRLDILTSFQHLSSREKAEL